MSISLEAPVITAKSERHSSLSPAQIMEIARAREASLSRLLMAYISSGLVFMLLPGTFLGVWNLLQISGRESAGSISPAWIQAHGHAQVFGWIGSFILGIGFYSIPKLRGATKPGLRCGLGMLGNVDNRCGGTLGRKCLRVAVAFAASALGRPRTGCVPDFLQRGFTAPA